MKKNLFTTAFFFAALLCAAPAAFAQVVVEQDITFYSYNQGWYKSGIPSYGKKDYLLGNEAKYFESFSVGSSSTVELEGKMGAAFDMFYDVLSMPDGNVDVYCPLKFTYTAPNDRSYGCGDEIAIQTLATPRPGYSITSMPPQFKMQVGVKAQVGAYIGIDSYFGGGSIVNTGNDFSNATSSNYEEKMRGGEYVILGFDTETGVHVPEEHSLPYILPPSVYNSIKMSGSIDNPFVNDPADMINGLQIKETGDKLFMDIDFDPIQFLGNAIGVQLAGSTSISGVGSASYAILQAPLEFDSHLRHDLQFNPNPMITLQLDRPYNYRVRNEMNAIIATGFSSTVTMRANHTLLVTVPNDNQPITLTPTYNLDNQFSTKIRYDMDVSLSLRALSASAQTISIEICDPTPLDLGCTGIGPYGVSIGPVVDENYDITSFGYDFYPQTTFKMSGFQTDVAGDPFTLYPDNEPPVVTPRNITLYIPDAGGSVSIVPQDVVQSINDVHGGSVRYLSVTPNVFDCSDLGDNPVQVRNDDSRCNEITTPATVTIIDRTKPLIECKPFTAYLNAVGEVGIQTQDVFQSGWDNCGIVNQQSVIPNHFDCSHIGPNTVTLTVNDGHGNSQTCTATVTVLDKAKPVIVCPANSTIASDGMCSGILGNWALVSKSDNCTTSSEILEEQYPVPTTPFNGHNQSRIVTFTATDYEGNTQTCSFTVTLRDNIKPGVACPANNTFEADGDCSVAIGAWTLASKADNCTPTSDITESQSPAATTLLNGHNASQTVTLTANDGHGNTNTCSFTLTLKDNTKPSITCPANNTVAADAGCMATIGAWSATSVGDNCTAPANISVTQSPASNTLLSGHNDVETIFLTANDGHGNTQTCSFTLTLKDNTNPGIACPANTTLIADNACSAALGVYAAASVSDNCASNPTVSQSPAASTILSGHNSAQTVTLTANDGHGNTNTCSFTVTLKDQTRPTLVCPSDKTINADANCSASLGSHTAASMSDNCTASANIAIAQSPAAATVLSGINAAQEVTLTATDAAGNTRTCVFNVTLKDNTGPTITCPANKTLYTSTTCTATLGTHSAASSSDNCSASVSVSQSPAAATVLSGHNTVQTVTLTADDGNGNTQTCQFSVTLKDNRKPNIGCPAAKTMDADANCEGVLGNHAATTVSDNCTANPTVSQSPAASTVLSGHNDAKTVTLTATDDAGNTRTCTFKVTLKDKTKPTLICPANKTINADASCQAAIGVQDPATLSDNCSTPSVTQVPDPSTVLIGYGATQQVTLTATDAGGNWIACAFNVTLHCPTGLGGGPAENRADPLSGNPGLEVLVYPNPNTGWFTTEVPGVSAEEMVEYVLRDGMGRELLRREGAGQQSFQLEDLPPAIYTLEVRSGERRQIVRVAVQR